jgi:hypothetical protein
MLDRLIGTQPISRNAIRCGCALGAVRFRCAQEQRRLLVGQGACTDSTNLSWPLIRTDQLETSRCVLVFYSLKCNPRRLVCGMCARSQKCLATRRVGRGRSSQTRLEIGSPGRRVDAGSSQNIRVRPVAEGNVTRVLRPATRYGFDLRVGFVFRRAPPVPERAAPRSKNY